MAFLLAAVSVAWSQEEGYAGYSPLFNPKVRAEFPEEVHETLGDGRDSRRRLRRAVGGRRLCAAGGSAAGTQADGEHKDSGEDHFLHVRIISFDSNCSHYITPADYRTLKNS